MLRTLRFPDGRIDWGGIFFGRIWPVAIFAIAGMLAFIGQTDPEYTARQCIPSGPVAWSLHLPCTGKTFDRALEMYLGEHPSLEIAGIAPFNSSVVLGSSGTEGYVVVFRDKQK